MMTIVTHVSLKPGNEPEWDTAMRKRLEAARSQEGWIGGQILIPLDDANRRILVGTWETRAHWEAWHQDPEFAATRERLEGLESGRSEWYEVLVDVRGGAARSTAGRAA
jgi:heme-degrading monooxygenase HmoA